MILNQDGGLGLLDFLGGQETGGVAVLPSGTTPPRHPPFSGLSRRLRLLTLIPVERLAAGDVYDLKWGVYEAQGGPFTLSAVDWSLRVPATSIAVASSSAAVNVADVAPDGRALQTFTCLIDLTAVAVGRYRLRFDARTAEGDADQMGIPVEVVAAVTGIP